MPHRTRILRPTLPLRRLPFRAPGGPFLFLLLLAGACAPATTPTEHSIIPAPRSWEPGEGAFAIGPETRIALSDPSDAELGRLAEAWVQSVRDVTTFALPIAADAATERGPASTIRLLVVEPPQEAGPDPASPERTTADASSHEGYRLEVQEQGITLSASGHAGIFYGLQTLDQMLPAGIADGAVAPLRIPTTLVEDTPRFPYRGMHLDVARHFFDADVVKRYIDLLARYKINHFHWHLTEDRGWRLEIERYPRLAEIAAWRDETMGREELRPVRG